MGPIICGPMFLPATSTYFLFLVCTSVYIGVYSLGRVLGVVLSSLEKAQSSSPNCTAKFCNFLIIVRGQDFPRSEGRAFMQRVGPTQTQTSKGAGRIRLIATGSPLRGKDV